MWLATVALLLVALGQPLWGLPLSLLAGMTGFALFWKGIRLFEITPKRAFWIASGWFALVQLVAAFLDGLDLIDRPRSSSRSAVALSFWGLQFGCVTLTMQKRAILGSAALWTVMELLRLHFLSGFSWNPTGLSLAASWIALSWSGLFGIFGLSFFVFWLNGLFLTARRQYLALLSLFWIGALLLSFWNQAQAEYQGTLSVLVVQTGKMPSFSQHPLERWEELLTQIAPFQKNDPDLILFPESTLAHEAHLPFLVRYQEKILTSSCLTLAQSLANRWDSEVVIGLEERLDGKSYQAALHLTPGNHAHTSYAKRLLVPLGEEIPFEWARGLAAHFGIKESFIAGRLPQLFPHAIPLGPSICYEETFGELVRGSRLAGALVLINLTNDGWYPHSSLPRQHLEHARPRTTENGCPLIRSCTTGVSAVIDGFGRTVWEAPTGQALTQLVRLPVWTYKTLYTLVGDSLISWISMGVLVLFSLRQKRLKR